MTVTEVFEDMPNHVDAAAAAGMDKTFQWNVTGSEAGVWAMHIKDGAGHMIRGGVEKPDVTFTVSGEDWVAMSEGKLNPMQAVLTRRLKIAGDQGLALRLQKLLPTPK